MLDGFVDGNLDEHLMDATISEAGIVLLRGSARLYFTPGSQYCYLDMTASECNAPEKFFGSSTASDGYVFTAQTKSGVRVSCEFDKLIPRTMYASTNIYEWHFRPFKIRLESELHSAEDCSTWMCVRSRIYHIEDTLWFKATSSVTDGMSSSKRVSIDWSQFEVLDCEFKLGKGDGKCSILEMLYPTDLPTETALSIHDAFLQALSLRVGGAIRCVCKSWVDGSGYITELYNAARGNSRHRFSISAFDFHHKEDEEGRFLKLATEYFLKEELVFPVFERIWDAELASNGSRNGALGAAVETFCDLLLERAKPGSYCATAKEFEGYKTKILAILGGLDVEKEDKDHHERIISNITSMRAAHAKEKIRQAHSVLGLRCNEDELSSWSGIRNYAAHNILRSKDPSINQHYYKARTLLLRLVLKDMGWDGPYYNLSRDRPREELLSACSRETTQPG